MKKIKWVILLASFLLGSFASSFALAASPLFTFNIPVNLVNIPGSIGPLNIFVNLVDKNNQVFAWAYAHPSELNVTSGVITFNRTVTITFSADQLNRHNPEEAIKYNVGICRSSDGNMLKDLMADNGSTPYDSTKPFNPGIGSLPIH